MEGSSVRGGSGDGESGEPVDEQGGRSDHEVL
jgi:hypothetical protein